jgi:hypothetical protein
MYPTTLSTSNAAAGAVTTAPIALDPFMSQFQATIVCTVTGTANYTVQYTLDNIQADGYVPASGNWITVTGLSAQTATQAVAFNQPVMAIKMVQNTGTGSVSMTVLQTGAGN